MKEKFPETTDEAPSMQNDAHALKNFLEDAVEVKKSFLLGHGHGQGHGYGHGYGHGQGHSQGHAYGHDKHLKHGGGYSYQVKQKGPYGHQQQHWNFDAGFPPGHMGGLFPPGHVKYMQDCTGKPNQPLNAMLKCTSNSNTCKATCMPDYKFPNGETTLLISCVEGEWIVQGAEWPQVPSCEPICMPQCLNNGICVSPGVCSCSDNFRGPQCQYEKKICLQKPSLPSNSRQTCSSSQCTISCAKGYRFPDGTTVTNVVCKDGDWKPTRGDWPTVPDCQRKFVYI